MNSGKLYSDERVPLPVHSVFKRMNIDLGEKPIEYSLNRTQIERRVLQDFCPLRKSLEWQLASLSWGDLGILPFAESDVPFIITNSGRLSEHTAVVLFESCKLAPPMETIRVMELGAGTGLFARLFLDSFRKLCAQQNADYYDRLSYIITDASKRSIEQWKERSIFEEHGQRVQPIHCNASSKEDFNKIKKQSLRAVFCNYILDVLPSTIVRQGKDGLEELHIRTHLVGDSSVVAQHTDLSYEQIANIAGSQDPEQHRKLLPLVTLLELETDFKPIDPVLKNLSQEALAIQSNLEKVLLNYGAMGCLESCGELLEKNGFILVNDYGPVDTMDVEKQMVSQRFGPTVALGINFPLLQKYLSAKSLRIVVPNNDAEAPIHARLISRNGESVPEEVFLNRFGIEGHSYFEQPILEARDHAQAGRKNEALESYKTALGRNQRDWYFLGEVAEYVGLQLADWSAGAELIQEAIKLNPWYSAWLWNVLGDCLFCQERSADAHEAYLQAHRIDPFDPRTNLNLAYSFSQFLCFDEALSAIARGLSHDKTGLMREQLLEKQRQILSQLSARSLGERERLVRRALSQQ